jgi:antitoxin component YwqK of YwqJK toxin-antitoxin module
MAISASTMCWQPDAALDRLAANLIFPALRLKLCSPRSRHLRETLPRDFPMLIIYSVHRFVAPQLALALVLAATPLAIGQHPVRLTAPHRMVVANGVYQDGGESTSASGADIVRDRYPDGKLKIKREVALDAAGNYVNHGEWIWLSEAGKTVAQGHFQMGQRTGAWVRWHGPNESPVLNQAPFKGFKAPFKSEATFANNQMEGQWLISDSAGRQCMLVTLHNGVRSGPVTFWLPNGNVYRQMTYEHGVPVGELLEADAKTGATKAVATFVEGRRLLTKTTNHPGGKQRRSEEQLLDPPTKETKRDDYWSLTLAEYQSEGAPLRHGPQKMWHSNGKLEQEGVYDEGKREGSFTYYHPNGAVAARGAFADDRPVGYWEWSHANGQRASAGQYFAGKAVGEWRWWKDDGSLLKEKSYEGDGTLVVEPPAALETSRTPAAEQTR